MGAQGKPPSSLNSMQRVKVYRLNDDGKWDDRGTGHVTVDYYERSEDPGLFVFDEEDNETLLSHRIRSDEIYRRQEDTIISWRDPEYSTELALSFQEATGCSFIWDNICNAQRNIHFNSLSDLEIGPRPATETLEASGTSQSNGADETYRGINSELRELPSVELATLPLILKIVVESDVNDQMRVTELIIRDKEFLPKLMDLFKICEDLENLDGLHMIFKLVKGIFLLNSPHIFEKMFGDDLIMDIVGSLEYDPDVPHVQHHRAFLKEYVVFKEAIPIKDPLILSKIHETYRVGYIKDVILPRALDEATITSLNSIIHGNNANVVSSLKDDSAFIQELFARMKSSTTSVEYKKNLVLFLHEFCNLSKSLQLVQQMRLFRDLVNEGIFDIITEALQSQDKRLVLTGTDILILFLNQDPNLLRMYVTRQEGNTLLGLLVKGMITDFGDDMHCQFLEILRSLLDSYTLSGSQRDTIIEIFYEKHLEHLIQVIVLSCSGKGATTRPVGLSFQSAGNHGAVVKPEILLNVCELLCFCVHHHPYRIKCNFLFNNVIEKVLYLTRRKEKYLVVAAVRFVRAIISRHDEQLLGHIVKNNVLKPIVDAFVANGNKYNLLNSAILELFEYIRKESLKTLIGYLVDSFWEPQLVQFNHLSSIRAFRVKYEQCRENGEAGRGSIINMVDPRKRIDERALEKEEEDYFNEDSDEEDTASAQSSHIEDEDAPQPTIPNGGGARFNLRPLPGGLVDYDDDEDDEDYIPPSHHSKPEAVEKSKRKSPSADEEDGELKKKRKLDKEDEQLTVSNNHHSVSSEPPDSRHQDEEEEASEKSEPLLSCSSDSSSAEAEADTRQSSSDGEDRPNPLTPSPPNGSNSPLELQANGEPFSVR